MADTVLTTGRAAGPARVLRAFRGLRQRHLALGISIFLLLLVAGTGLLADWIAAPITGRANRLGVTPR